MSLNLDIPDAPRLRDTLAGVALFVLCIASGVTGYWIRGGNLPKPEVIRPAPEVRQVDGSLELAVQPTPKPTPAPHQLPANSKELRRAKVTLQPQQPGCDPVSLNLSLVQDGDTTRLITSGEGAAITGGVDMPIKPILLPAEPLKWTVLGGVNVADRSQWSVGLNRDIGRLVLGGEVRTGERGDVQGWAHAGFRFNF